MIGVAKLIDTPVPIFRKTKVHNFASRNFVITVSTTAAVDVSGNPVPVVRMFRSCRSNRTVFMLTSLYTRRDLGEMRSCMPF